MARIRTIKPEFFDDETLCVLPFSHRLCYIALWTQADKAGRLEDRPLRLKARIFPYDDVDMDAILAELARGGFVIRYLVDGKPYVAIKPSSWAKHQRVRTDEPETVLPAPDAGTVTNPSRRSDDSVSVEMLGKERKGKEVEGMYSPEAADGSGPVLTFPTVGTNGSVWELSEAQVAEWVPLFPTVDVIGELQHALAWVKANPGRRKTGRGMPKFCVGWLTRATDHGRGRNGGSLAERPFSASELEQARSWRRAVGRCTHDPECEDSAACMARYIRTRLRLEPDRVSA